MKIIVVATRSSTITL